MEKFFLKSRSFSIENWQIGLLLIVTIVLLVGFGALVEKAATDENAPGVAKVFLSVARIPAESRNVVKQMLSDDRLTLAKRQRFEGQSGFQRIKPGEDGTLLLSRFDGDENRSVVEIMDLEDGAVLHRYAPDVRGLNALSERKSPLEYLLRDKGPNLYRMHHAYLTDDSGLIFHGSGSPLAKIDLCSNIVWLIDRMFHHAIERDASGNYWALSRISPPTIPNVTEEGHDDALVQISPDGDILFEKSIGTILIDNKLSYLLHSSIYPDDPLHTNDVQPVMESGPYWQAGDLFLSMRSNSTVVLYRPSTNKVIWHRQGPWMKQHDVDIINDHKIAIFNNSAADLPWGPGVMGTNETLVYDFATDEISSPFAEGYKANDLRTEVEGLQEIRPDGEILIEETNYGRLVKMNAVGDISWQYVNRASDGRNYITSWVRYINDTQAQRAADLAAATCSDDA